MNAEQLGTRITFRLTETQEKSLQEAMKIKHITKASEFVRQAVLAEIERALSKNQLLSSIEETLEKIREDEKQTEAYVIMRELGEKLEIYKKSKPLSTVQAMAEGIGKAHKKASPLSIRTR